MYRNNQWNVAPCDGLWDLVLDMDWTRAIQHAKLCPQDAAWQDGHWHETPLYLACQNDAPVAVIRALKEAFPGSTLVTCRANHDLPLHIACRYQVPLDVLEELLRGFPQTAAQHQRWGKSPLYTLWDFRQSENGEFWQKVYCLLFAVAEVRGGNPQSPRRIPMRRHSSAETTHKDPTSSGLLVVHAAGTVTFLLLIIFQRRRLECFCCVFPGAYSLL